MRGENVIALKEIMIDEIRRSLREECSDKNDIAKVIKYMDTSILIKKNVKSSFDSMVRIIDDDVSELVEDIVEILKEDLVQDLEDINNTDEYWGE